MPAILGSSPQDGMTSLEIMSALEQGEIGNEALPAMLSIRRLIYAGALLAVLSGSFFLTLWQLDDGRDKTVDPADSRSDSERLASQRVTDYSELRRAAKKAGLKLSIDMIGKIEGYSRANERDVTISGWLADPEGDSTPLKV